MLTATQFADLFPNCKDPEGWVNAMNEVFPKYEINTPERIAAFIAQCGHESGGWRTFSENLNYSAAGLRKTFGKYFATLAIANSYTRQPERIANRVYANRMGNGNEASRDGWKFRGRGFIQITGKANYIMLSKDTRIDFLNNPDLLLTEANSMISALWFWNRHKLNALADKNNIVGITRIINGGLNGLSHRKELLNKYRLERNV